MNHSGGCPSLGEPGPGHLCSPACSPLGLGLALNFQPSLIMLNRYFNKRRPMANGLAAAGSPVFLCALSPLGQVLQDHYGWRGGFLILGGLLLNCCVCAALMRPLEAPRQSLGSGPAPQRPPRRLLDLSVFRDRGFVIYALASSIMVLGLFVPPVFVVNYAKDLGVPDTKAAFLLTILGFIDIFARPTAGFITGLKKVRPYSVYLFSFAMFFNGFTDLTGSTASDYGGLVVFCIFFGISYGMVGALQFEVLMAIVGTQKFSSAIGLVLLLEAIAVLIGPPSGGECWREAGWGVSGLPSLGLARPLGSFHTCSSRGVDSLWGALSWKGLHRRSQPCLARLSCTSAHGQLTSVGEHSLLYIPGPAWFHCGKSMGLSRGNGSRIKSWSSFLTVPTPWGHSELRPGSAFVTLGFYFLIAEKIMVGCGSSVAKALPSLCTWVWVSPANPVGPLPPT